MTEWIPAKIIKLHKWTPQLFKIILQAPIKPFIAGQFTKLAIQNIKKKYIKRVYSFVNPPFEKNLEFCIRLIPNGTMSTKLYHMHAGDKIFISKYSAGFFTMNEIPINKHLWMFATGTAIGPFCSILQDGNKINQFQKIILVYAARYTHELVYLPLIKQIKQKYKNKLIIQTIISRDKNTQSLTGHIPQLLEKKTIEKKIGHYINPNDSHIMLCGNPEMVSETQSFLIQNRNLQKHFRKKPGHISTENYW